MAGEDFLKLNNGQKLSLSNFKEIKEEDLKNTDAGMKNLFNIFAGDDHILQADEAQSLWLKLKTAAAANKNGDNKVFDDEEIQKLLDTDIDIKNFSKNSKFSINSLTQLIKQIFTKPNTQISNNVQSQAEFEMIEYTPEDIKNLSLQALSDDVRTARVLYNTQNSEQGVVSDLVNGTKELFDTEFASSRVGRYISKEELCADLLQQSKSPEGLTLKAYLESKILFILDVIENLEKYSLRTEITQDTINISLKALSFGIEEDKKTQNSQEIEAKKTELNNLKSILARLRPEEINLMISQLLSIEENPEQASYELSFGGKANNVKPQEYIDPGIESPIFSFSPVEYEAEVSEGSLLSLNKTEANKKISFEETFKKERGVEYNSDAIMDYTQKRAYMQFLLGMHNRREEISNLLKETQFIEQSLSTGSGTPEEIQYDVKNLMSNLPEALKILYRNDAQKIQEFLDSIYEDNNKSSLSDLFKEKQIKVITNEKGEFVSLDFGINLVTADGKLLQTSHPMPNTKLDKQTINSVIKVASKLQANIDANYEKVLNGKTIEEYSAETAEAYAKAYGEMNAQEAANAFSQSQQEGVETVKGVVTGIGTAVMIAGQLIPVGGQLLAFGGLAAIFGSSAVEATELLTKDAKVTREDIQKLVKELVTSLALTATGIKAGKMSEGVYRYLSVVKQCPKLLAFATEIGIDATMSLVADLAITGQIDLSGEGIAQLGNIIVGLLHSKGNLKNYLNNHALETPKTVSLDEQELKYETENFKNHLNNHVLETSKTISLGEQDVKYQTVGNNTTNPAKEVIKPIAEQQKIEEFTVENYINNMNRELAFYMQENNFSPDMTINILSNTSKRNIELAEALCKDKDFPKEEIGKILKAHKKFIRNMLFNDYSIEKINEVNEKVIKFINVLCNDKKFFKEDISPILENITEDNLSFAEKIYSENTFYKDYMSSILQVTNKDNILLAEKMYNDQMFASLMIKFLEVTNKGNLPLAEKLYNDNKLPKKEMIDILKNTGMENLPLAEILYNKGEFDIICQILQATKDKNIPLEKFNDDTINRIKELYSNLQGNHFNLSADLIDLTANCPEKSQHIMESGIFGMINNGTISTDILKLLNKNSDFSEDIYSDLAIVQNGKSIVPEFPAGIDLNEAFAQSKAGDAVEIGKKMYINDGTSLVEWKMTKEKFLELFPPVERFATMQGQTGDCYLLSPLSHIMRNPNTRAELYKSFEFDGKDVTVTVKGYENYNGSYTFDGGKLGNKDSYRLANACDGIKMYEFTYAKVALRTTGGLYPGTMKMNDLMDRIDGGRQSRTISEILGYEHGSRFIEEFSNAEDLEQTGFFNVIPYKDPVTSEVSMKDIKNLSPDNFNKILDNYDIDFGKTPLSLSLLDGDKLETILARAANSNNFILEFGTLSDIPEYNIRNHHAHSIIGYDPINKMVQISQPHNYAITTEIPLDVLRKTLSNITYTKISNDISPKT